MSTLHFTDLAVSRLATPGTYYDQTTPARLGEVLGAKGRV
jgi:hypothetical protein